MKAILRSNRFMVEFKGFSRLRQKLVENRSGRMKSQIITDPVTQRTYQIVVNKSREVSIRVWGDDLPTVGELIFDKQGTHIITSATFEASKREL